MSCILVSRSIGGVFVDVVISEEHTASMEIAEHPVESGAKISDHAWRMPYKVVLESVVDASRAVSSYQQLLAVQERAEAFSLITGLKVYSNMLIKEIVATRDKEHARVLKFTAELQEVIIVNTQSGGGNSNSSSTDSDSAKSTTSRGQVAARPANDIPSSSNSILSGAIAAD
jgi:hypothetical protein